MDDADDSWLLEAEKNSEANVMVKGFDTASISGT